MLSVSSYFCAKTANLRSVTETTWLAKRKILSLWHFTECKGSVLTPALCHKDNEPESLAECEMQWLYSGNGLQGSRPPRGR